MQAGPSGCQEIPRLRLGMTGVNKSQWRAQAHAKAWSLSGQEDDSPGKAEPRRLQEPMAGTNGVKITEDESGQEGDSPVIQSGGVLGTRVKCMAGKGVMDA